jgi:hypothetical protein
VTMLVRDGPEVSGEVEYAMFGGGRNGRSRGSVKKAGWVYLGSINMHAGVLETGSAKLYVAKRNVHSTNLPEVDCLHEEESSWCPFSLPPQSSAPPQWPTTLSSNGVPPGARRYTTRKSIHVHSIAVHLKLPPAVVPMLRVSFMPFSAFGPYARRIFGDEYAFACTFSSSLLHTKNALRLVTILPLRKPNAHSVYVSLSIPCACPHASSEHDALHRFGVLSLGALRHNR